MLCKPEKVSPGKAILFALQAKTHFFLLFRQHQPGVDNVIGWCELITYLFTTEKRKIP
jgi:hypothetical protein